VITGEDLAKAGLARMLTLFHDKQMVLATGKVLEKDRYLRYQPTRDRLVRFEASE
jgi:hypothetical protein